MPARRFSICTREPCDAGPGAAEAIALWNEGQRQTQQAQAEDNAAVAEATQRD